MLTENEFIALKQMGYQRIPLMVNVLTDLDTPLSLYLKFAQQSSYAFLLESVVGGERFARYSYVGIGSDRIIAQGYGENTKTTWFKANENTTQVFGSEHNPLDVIATIEAQYNAAPILGMPRFCGGLIGYFGYETVHYIEPSLPAPKSNANPHLDLDVPDIQLMLCETLLVIDNLKGQSHLIVYADANKSDGYQQACYQIKQVLERLKQSPEVPLGGSGLYSEPNCTTQANDYQQACNVAIEAITQGEAMQIVLSKRSYQQFKDSPIALYRALRSLNPSPYMYFYKLDDTYIVGASPELLMRFESQDRTLALHPIAGTRPRGQTAQEDAQLAEELRLDTKERAEHTMLIDLARNDIGKVAVPGSVEVVEHMQVERYSHVQHLVSLVEGKVSKGINSMDMLKAVFPAGTLSGAPKVRAMQIIHDLEPHKRNIYGGAVGYISFQGDIDLAISIRTAIVKNNYAYVQAGAGVVYDSIPAKEWQETEDKAKAVIQAIKKAQMGV